MVCRVPKIEDISDDNTVLDQGVINVVVERWGNEEFVLAVIDGRLNVMESELHALQTQVSNSIQATIHAILRLKVAKNSSYAVIRKFS